MGSMGCDIFFGVLDFANFGCYSNQAAHVYSLTRCIYAQYDLFNYFVIKYATNPKSTHQI